MPSVWLRRAVEWSVGALVGTLAALLLLGPADSSVNLAAIAALAIAAVVAWSLLRPATADPYGAGRRVPAPAHVAGPMRSFHPDAPGRPRPRAPGA